MTRSPLLSVLSVLLVAACALGCSNDRRYLTSTVNLPLEYELVDAYTQEVMWSLSVPVQHELMVDLDREEETEWASVSNHPATRMKWAVAPIGKRGQPMLEGSMSLPGTPVIERLNYRAAPEFPQDTVELVAPTVSPRLRSTAIGEVQAESTKGPATVTAPEAVPTDELPSRTTTQSEDVEAVVEP